MLTLREAPSRQPGRRALLAVAGALVVLAALVAGRVVYVRRVFVQEYAEQLDKGLPHTTRVVSTWADQRRTQAALLATVAGQVPEVFDTGEPGAAARRRFEAILRAVVGKEGYTAAWLTDASGRVMSSATYLAARGSAGPPPPPLDGPGRAVVPVATAGPGATLDFRAPVMVRDSSGTERVLGAVALRADPSAFFERELNPTVKENRTGRTSIVARQGDSIVFLASESNAPRPSSLPRLAWDAAPAHLRAVLGGRPGHGVLDARESALGSAAAYAALPIPELGWGLVRQRDRAELLRAIRPNLIVESVIWSVLGLLLIGVLWFVVRSRAQRREQDLARLRTDFVSGVSHELRTPLAQIRLFAQLLRAGTLRTRDDTDRALRVIDQEARRLTFLVDNVLNFARGDRAPRVEPVVTEVVNEIIEAIEAFAPLAAERGAELREDLQVGLYALVDPRALRQVLLNFLDNAVKYGPRGQTVTIGAALVGMRVRVWVDDEGDGVPPDERENVWRPFYRIGVRSGAEKASGSGIGLAVVHELALQHGGTVWVEDAPEGGARFVAEFPAADRTPTPVQSMLAAVRPAGAGAPR